MSYDEWDAAQDAYYDQIGIEAVAGFTRQRLVSYYDDHDHVMLPAQRALQEGDLLLLAQHPSAAIVFFASSTELFLKATLLKPLVHGLVHNDKMADIIVNHALGQTGFTRYQSLFAKLFNEIVDRDLVGIRRSASSAPLVYECSVLAAQRNDVLHKGLVFGNEEATAARSIAHAVYESLVQPMVDALGLHILKDGTLSSTPYRTIMGPDGFRLMAEDTVIGGPDPKNGLSEIRGDE